MKERCFIDRNTGIVHKSRFDTHPPGRDEAEIGWCTLVLDRETWVLADTQATCVECIGTLPGDLEWLTFEQTGTASFNPKAITKLKFFDEDK